jgi:beta-lactam-binding protein with PASTA domain
MTGDTKLDGKYEVIRELEQDEARRVVEARHPDGRTVRLDWFSVNNPKSRSNFHRYRTALKVAASPLMLDAVARPGAYYTVWEQTNAPSAAAWLQSHARDEGFRRGLETLAGTLSEHGFALTDARVVAVQDEGNRDTRPVLADLHPADRTPEEIAGLNRPVLASSSTPIRKAWSFPGRTQGKAGSAQPTAAQASNAPTTTRQRRKITVWGVLPGLIFLGFAGYLGVAATQSFLEPPVVTVPDVVGKPLKDAAQLISDARLTARLAQGNDQTKPRGVILRQSPASGTTLTESRVVEITVNSPRPLEVPDLTSKSRGDALFTLRELGLEAGRIATVPTKTGDLKGVILGQNPAPGTQVTKGSKVTLLISGDPAPPGQTFIPDLKGLSLEDAKFILEKSGLTLVEVREQSTTRQQPGVVIGQTPAPNKLVAESGEATLTITVAPEAREPYIPSPPVPPVPPAPRPAPTITPPPPTPPANTAPEPPATPPTPPSVTPEPPPSPTTPTNVTPEPPPPTPPTEPERRRASFSWTIPTTYGTVSVEVRVTDADGERVIQGPLQAQGGLPITVSDYEVRGEATFVVFIDGVSAFTERR